jgi:hypothetical protein
VFLLLIYKITDSLASSSSSSSSSTSSSTSYYYYYYFDGKNLKQKTVKCYGCADDSQKCAHLSLKLKHFVQRHAAYLFEKSNKYHDVETVLIIQWKSVETETNSIPLTHIWLTAYYYGFA